MVRRSLFSRLFARLSGRPSEAGATHEGLGHGGTILAGRQPIVAAAGAGATPPGVGGRFDAGLERPGDAGTARMSPAPGPTGGATTTAGAGAVPVDVERVDPPPENGGTGEKAARTPKAKDVKPSKMAPQEELSLKITEGLSSLSGLLDQIDDKLATQNRNQLEVREQLTALPRVLSGMAETQKASLEAVRDVRQVLQTQVETSQHQAKTLDRLPGIVEGVGDKVDEQNRTGTKVRESVESVGKSVRNLADSSQRAQHTMLAEFRRAQDEHRRRLEELVDRERKTIFVVAGLALLVVVCLVLILVNQTGG